MQFSKSKVVLAFVQILVLVAAPQTFAFFSLELNTSASRATCDEEKNPGNDFFSQLGRIPPINKHFNILGEQYSALNNANFCSSEKPFVKALRYYQTEDGTGFRKQKGIIFIFSSLADTPPDSITGRITPALLHPEGDFYIAVMDEYELTLKDGEIMNVDLNTRGQTGKVTYNWSAHQNQCHLTGIALEGFGFISGFEDAPQTELSKNHSKIYFTRKNPFSEINGRTGTVDMVVVPGGHPSLEQFKLYCAEEFQRHALL